jgi:RNA polymerase sigma-70 factor (ECF subfamily)
VNERGKSSGSRDHLSDRAELTVDFETLYERFARATFVFFLRKTGDSSWAADLNQELYMRLSRSMRRFEGRCSWRTWIFTI